MTTPANISPRPSELLPSLLYILGEASSNRQTFSDLDPQTKGHLALFGYFGSDPANAPDPGHYWPYHGRSNQGRALDTLATNSDLAMSRVPEYDQARQDGTLGLTMALAYTAVRAVRHHGVHVADPTVQNGEVVDGVVAAMVTSYTVPDEDTSTLLHTLFQGMHSKFPEQHIVKPLPASPDWQAPTDPWDKAWIPPSQAYHADGRAVETQAEPQSPRPHTVEVANLTEYQRIITEAIRILVRKELAAIGVVTPEHKVPLNDWLKTQTFPPEIQAWLQAIDDTYNAMHEHGFVQADYIDDPDGATLAPGRRKHIIGTDPSATSKAERDGFNGRAHALKARGGDSRHNQEQHPNRHERYSIERHVNLRRPRPPKPGTPYYAPSTARPLNVFERAVIEIGETWREVKENPERHIPDMLGSLLGKVYGGAADLAMSGSILLAKGIVALGKGAKSHWLDFAAWKGQKQLAHSRLDIILEELQLLQTAIAEQRLSDRFPNTNLPPSKQLELVKSMTAMMLANLQ